MSSALMALLNRQNTDLVSKGGTRVLYASAVRECFVSSDAAFGMIRLS